MLWKDRRQSDNIEDRRGMSGGGRMAIGGGLGGIVVLVLALLLGADPRKLLEQLEKIETKDLEDKNIADKVRDIFG